MDDFDDFLPPPMKMARDIYLLQMSLSQKYFEGYVKGFQEVYMKNLYK